MFRLVALTALLLLARAAAASAQEAEYVREYRAAGEHTLGCFGSEQEIACQEMIAAYDRAMNAPDATASVRHRVFKDYIHAHAVYGGNVREQRGAAAALEILAPAYAAMLEHFAGGQHFHTLIDNLRLQQEMALALAEVGRYAEADEVFATARGAADKIYGDRARIAGDQYVTDLLHQAYIGSESLETEVATFFRGRGLDASRGAAAEADLDRAIHAYRRAELWLRRKVDAGIRGPMDAREDLRLAELKLELGVVLLNRERNQEAEEAFLAAAAFSCPALDPQRAARLNVPPAQLGDAMFFEPVCERATLGWSVASGEADRIIAGAVDRLIRGELEFLNGVLGMDR